MMVPRDQMTQAIAQDHLEYDPTSGHLIWITKKHSRKVVVGTRAGSISTKGRHRVLRFLGILYAEHRFIWLHYYGQWPVGHIDHINHDEQDNRIENLRDVTQAKNNMNSSRRRDNGSGHVGVWINKLNTHKKYMAELHLHGERVHYSSHYTLNAAIQARQNAEKQFGFHPNHGIPKPLESSTTIKSGVTIP